MYKEDLELKNKFFYELDHLDEWESYSKEESQQIYSKKEDGSNIISCLYKVKLDTNIIYPLALLS